MLSVDTLIVLGGTAVTALLIVAGLAAWAFVHWTRLRTRELELTRGASPTGIDPSPGNRIDLADLKERVRKLEAIASGVNF
jgi:hypothetical protein